MVTPLISMLGITKRFPGVIANNKINLELYPGEIHALLGENGSGKSTLMSILTGLYQPTEGKILVEGKETQFSSPADAIKNGIGTTNIPNSRASAGVMPQLLSVTMAVLK